MIKRAFFCFLLLTAYFSSSCKNGTLKIQYSNHDLVFDSLATQWDEAIPLGNGMLGALVWNNNGKLRISLDRADLWDLRPMENLDSPNWRYSWVYEQWKNNSYQEVQNNFDWPYDRSPAPSKIPAAALELDIESLGKISEVRLSIKDACCTVSWQSGVKLFIFVHAMDPVGWYSFENLSDEIKPMLIQPPYAWPVDAGTADPVSGQDLRRLGYESGKVAETENSIVYKQKGWGGFQYQVATKWIKEKNKLLGSWSISSHYPEEPRQHDAKMIIDQQSFKDFNKKYRSHQNWWDTFWSKSALQLPDKLLEKQWYLEMYKFGSVARDGAPPISLQAVWTADNGKLPPWKGDFHHDLNTQLSYWPAYSSNHLDLEAGFINWLWKNKNTFKEYTRSFFQCDGLNVPGVSTLTGQPMGGWIQYAFGPTVSAWLGQHFYWHWRYTMDRNFLQEKAYPWIKEVAIFLEQLSIQDENTGLRKFPLSSSPEINDNSRDAWFPEMTNFDLALVKWTYEKAAELAKELDQTRDYERWQHLLAEWPEYAIDNQIGLKFAPALDYQTSHRHFSHLMAFHPLGLIDYSRGDSDIFIISNTLKNLETQGSDWWTGYSFAWQGNLYARALDGENAANVLKTFATCFCLPNSFHVNGDQSGTGKSKFTYRPFTLEGNFAFAAGLQEMLLQSHTGTIKIFPAIPDQWKNLSFDNFLAQGAFQVSAQMKEGKVEKIEIMSLKGGHLKLANAFHSEQLIVKGSDGYDLKNGLIMITMKANQKIILLNRNQD
ncbi:MAG: glycoside hydrolase N-terminal domain-containing protein [Candidatus Marinimicrobia bacterium]|nr:glycoside hydrolase N-terminal domain-containing protein [Candidatus Neomarinimicrobiota bacterium]